VDNVEVFFFLSIRTDDGEGDGVHSHFISEVGHEVDGWFVGITEHGVAYPVDAEEFVFAAAGAQEPPKRQLVEDRHLPEGRLDLHARCWQLLQPVWHRLLITAVVMCFC
jgi:hypothetical protein